MQTPETKLLSLFADHHDAPVDETEKSINEFLLSNFRSRSESDLLDCLDKINEKAWLPLYKKWCKRKKIKPVFDYNFDSLLKTLKEDSLNKNSWDKIFEFLNEKSEMGRELLFGKLKKELKLSLKIIKSSFEKFQKKFKREGNLLEYEGTKYTIPPGFEMKSQLCDINGNLICHNSIFIDSFSRDRISGKTFVNLIQLGSEKKSKLVEMAEISSRQKIIELSSYGFEFHSQNGGKVIKFLHDFFHINKSVIQKNEAVSQLGWLGNKFIFPGKVISPDNKIEKILFLRNTPDPSDFSKKGTLEKQIEMIKKFQSLGAGKYQRPIFKIYAFLAGHILNKFQNSENLILHTASESGLGKTTEMKFLCSLSGKPESFNSFDDTETSLVRKAAILKNIPLMINESSTKVSQSMVRLVYNLSEGRSRMKSKHGSESDISKQFYFKSFIFANGECYLTAPHDLTGSLMRIILFDDVYGGINPEFVSDLEKCFCENYGHITEKFLVESMNTDFSKFDYFYDDFNLKDSKINLYIRRRNSIQPIYIAGLILEKLFNLGFDPKKICDWIFFNLEQDIKDNIGVGLLFLRFLQDYVASNPQMFVNLDKDNLTSTEIDSPQNKGIFRGILGYKKENDLLIFPEIFRRDILQAYNGNRGGRNSDVVLKELKNNEKLNTESKGHSKVHRFQGQSRRFIDFKDFYKHSE